MVIGGQKGVSVGLFQTFCEYPLQLKKLNYSSFPIKGVVFHYNTFLAVGISKATNNYDRIAIDFSPWYVFSKKQIKIAVSTR